MICSLLSGQVLWAMLMIGPVGAPAAGVVSLEDQELIDYLLRSASGSGAGNLAERIGHRMDVSAQRVGQQRDLGRQTQRLQQRIVDDLDLAIDQMQRGRSVSDASEADEQQQRQSDRPAGQAPSRSGQAPTATAGVAAGGGGVGATSGDRQADRFEEGRREWGNLPPRDRDQVIQGRDRPYMEHYRDLIERYYRALAGPQQTP